MENEVDGIVSLSVAAIAGAALLAVVLVLANASKGLYRNEQEFEMMKEDMANQCDLMDMAGSKTISGGRTATGNDIMSFMLKHTGEYFYVIDTGIGSAGLFLLADITHDTSSTAMSTDDVRNGFIAEYATPVSGVNEWQYTNTTPTGCYQAVPLTKFQSFSDETEVSMDPFTYSDSPNSQVDIALKRWTDSFLGNNVFKDTLTEDYTVYPVYLSDSIVGFFCVR